MGFFVFPVEIPTDIVLPPADDLQKQGRGDLSRGVGNISEVTHWFYEAFPFTAMTHQHRSFKKKKKKEYN